jgi:immune inhibitor A
MLATVAVRAARAYSEPFVVNQPDGTQLTLVLNGDEHMSWLTTSDGTIVMKTPQGYCVASIDDNGGLVASHLVAHQPVQRTAEEQQVCQLQLQRRSLFFQQVNTTWNAARRAQVTSKNYFPHSGSPKCLVILAQFSDKSFTSENAHEQFEQYMNGDVQEDMGHKEDKNLVSVKKYFEQSSQGQFTPQFDVKGPYTLPQTLEYYGKNQGTTKDVNFNQFCKDAIAAVDDEVDFKDYDNDNDGDAELVCIIYAGCGEQVSGNPAETIWPKCSSKYLETNDGVKVNYINCGAELRRFGETNINGIGVFCHEFSHGMGLPDLYATVDKAQINNQTPEYWDLMDYGEHANNGYAPVPYTAWEQEAMGWIEVEKLENTQNVTEMLPLVKGGKAYKFSNGADENEWIYLENVQPRDNDNQIPGFAYGHGLLAMHIAYASSKVTMYDYPNNTADTPRVCVVPADGLVINGYLNDGGYTQDQYTASLKADPFPSTYKKDESTVTVTALTADMGLPNYTFYNGEAMPKQSLTDIKEENGVISFFFNDGTTTGVKDIISKMSEVRGDYYNLNGQRVTKPTERGIYIQNGKKIMVR